MDAFPVDKQVKSDVGLVMWQVQRHLVKCVDSQELIQTAALPVFGLAMVALGASLWALRDRTGIEGQLSIAIAVTVLASPNTHPYDLLILAPALVYVSRRSWGVLVGPVFVVLSWLTLPQPYRWIMILALVAFAAVCADLLRRDALASPTSPAAPA